MRPSAAKKGLHPLSFVKCPVEQRFLAAVILAWLLLVSRPADAQSAIKLTTVAPPPNVQANSDPSIHTIESSNLDADFSPGERTTNAPAELDEIYATHDGYLNSTGIDEPLDLLSNPLVQLYQATGLRLGAANTMLSMEPIGGQSPDSGTAYDIRSEEHTSELQSLV